MKLKTWNMLENYLNHHTYLTPNKKHKKVMHGKINYIISKALKKSANLFFLRPIIIHNEIFLYSTRILTFKEHIKKHNISTRLLYNYGNS